MYIIHHQEHAANPGKWVSTSVQRERADSFIDYLKANKLAYIFKPSTVRVSISSFYS